MKYDKLYYTENKDRFHKIQKKYRDKSKNKIKAKESRDKWNKKNPNYFKDLRKKQRIICIEHYSSGKNCCNCCGEDIFEFLSLDHLNGSGSKHRKDIKNNHLALWLIKNNFPQGFQILCHNCNQAKGYNGICPHELDKVGKHIIGLNLKLSTPQLLDK